MPQFELFLLSSIALTLAPGPDNIYVLTRGISQGKSAAVSAALGFASGCLWHTLLAALGFAALIRQSELAFNLLKYAGAAYLFYIGIKALTGKSNLQLDTRQDNKTLWLIYRQSIIANMLNPKVTLFFIAFLPQFIDMQAGHLPTQMLLLGLLFMVQTAIIFGSIGLCSGWVGAWLKAKPGVASKLDTLAGLTFIGLGVRVALQSQK